jgi:hypothetical protein
MSAQVGPDVSVRSVGNDGGMISRCGKYYLIFFGLAFSNWEAERGVPDLDYRNCLKEWTCGRWKLVSCALTRQLRVALTVRSTTMLRGMIASMPRRSRSKAKGDYKDLAETSPETI